MKKNAPKKLVLSKETVLSLEKGALGKAAGGSWSVPVNCTLYCDSDGFTQCNNSWCQCA